MNTDDLLIHFVETLDRELELLATIRYRLIVLGALASSDQGCSIPTAVHEAEIAFEALRLSELVRASATVRLADELNLDPMPRIGDVAACVDGGWGEILLDRRRALIEAVTDIQGVARSLTEAISRRAALSQDALRFLQTDGQSTYGRNAPRGGVLVEGMI